MVTSILFPLDLSVDGSMENVCKEVSSRLDPRVFKTIAFSSQERTLMANTRLLRVPDWKSRTKGASYVLAALKMSSSLPKLAAVSKGILSTISIPQHVIFQRIRRKDKLVHTFHGVPIFNREGYIAGKILSRKANVVISVSKYCALLAKKYYGVDSRIIYNGVDTNFFKPQLHHNERLRVLFVGRFRKIKRPWYVIGLAKEFPQCDFLLYGENYPLGPTLKRISSNLRNVNISSFVPHEQMRHVYEYSDIFLYPSISEGFSLAVLEAAACGLPIVCSNAASLPEFVEQCKSGLLFNDYKEAKAALSYLIEDENARKDFSRMARAKAIEFDWSAIAQQYARLYQEIDGIS